jgi:hypothetical protein
MANWPIVYGNFNQVTLIQINKDLN